MSDTTNQPTEPTEKELQEYRENMKKYYDVQISLLKKQKEYEVLLADIEEARAKRISMNIRIAQMMAPPPERPTEEEMADAQSRMKEAIEEEDKSPKTRNLKKQ